MSWHVFISCAASQLDVWDSFFHGTVILFGFEQECCMLTDDILLLEKGGCALALLCIAVFLHLSHLCSVPLPGCSTCALPGKPGQHGSIHPSLCMALLPVHLLCLQTLILENKLKASPPTQPKHTTSQFSHYFSNLNCKHDFVAFNCQSLLDLFSPLGHQCCK